MVRFYCLRTLLIALMRLHYVLLLRIVTQDSFQQILSYPFEYLVLPIHLDLPHGAGYLQMPLLLVPNHCIPLSKLSAKAFFCFLQEGAGVDCLRVEAR